MLLNQTCGFSARFCWHSHILSSTMRRCIFVMVRCGFTAILRSRHRGHDRHPRGHGSPFFLYSSQNIPKRSEDASKFIYEFPKASFVDQILLQSHELAPGSLDSVCKFLIMRLIERDLSSNILDGAFKWQYTLVAE